MDVADGEMRGGELAAAGEAMGVGVHLRDLDAVLETLPRISRMRPSGA